MNKCSICKEEFSEHACNAQPITLGECCPRCDDLIVTPVRMIAAVAPYSCHVTVVDMFRQAIAIRVITQEMRKEATTWREKE